MTMFIVPELHAALVALLNDRPALNETQVTNGYAGDDAAEPERIFTADSRTDNVAPAGLKAGRTHYQESGEFDVVIDVIQPDGTPAITKARCMELCSELAECVADNRTLGGVPGLNYVVCRRWQLDTRYGELGSWSQIHYTIGYEARLT